MKVIVCGGGRVGRTIAHELAGERMDITVIDSTKHIIDSLTASEDVRGVLGYAPFPNVLKEAGASEADALIAVMRSDEVNMVACQVAHSFFKIPLKIARIRAQEYLDRSYKDFFMQNSMPVDVIISPERECALELCNLVFFPSTLETRSFIDDRIWAFGIKVDSESPVIGTPMNQIRELFPKLKGTVVGVMREGRLFCPSTDDQLFASDIIYLIIAQEDTRYALDLLAKQARNVSDAIIVGGGNVGLFTAQKLEMLGVRITLIENNHGRANKIAASLKRATVICGDAMESHILREAGIADADMCITVTNDQKVNLLASVLARQLGCKRSLALVNDEEYTIVGKQLGIDRFINPRSITTSEILRHTRPGRIKNILSLQSNQGEVIDAIALDTSSLVDKPLRECNIPSGVRIGAVVRGTEVMYPDGSMRIKPDDRVIVFSLKENVKNVEKLFKVSIDFFA